MLSIYFSINESHAATFDDIWWIGGTEATAAGYVRIIYTYPDQVQANEEFHVGITLEYIKETNPRSNWVSFPNLSVLLNEVSTNKTYYFSDNNNKSLTIIKPGEQYSQSIKVTAPSYSGEYIVGIVFDTVFGPGTTLWSFKWTTLDYYNATDREFGIIYPEESPPMNITEPNNKNYYQLGLKLQQPYNQLKNITIILKNATFDNEIFMNENDTQIPLKYNSTYTLSIPETIEMSKDEFRGVFLKWSDGYNSNQRKITMNENVELYAMYKPQYYLDVTSDVGKPIGSGWYNSSEKAEFSIDPLSGLFLLKSFDHWSKDHPGITDINIPSGFINMDGPKEIHAEWDYDLAFLGLLSGILATSLTIAGLIRPILRKITRRREQISIRCIKCNTLNLSTSKHCNQCGTKLEII